MICWFYRSLETDVFNMELWQRFPLRCWYQSIKLQSVTYQQAANLLLIAFWIFSLVLGWSVFKSKQTFCLENDLLLRTVKVIFMPLGLVNPFFTICELLKYPNLCTTKGGFSIRVAVNVLKNEWFTAFC